VKRGAALLPEREGLRRAVAWLMEQPSRDAATIEEASRRFDLSPVDEDFLLSCFSDGKGGQ
jgi:hypothetical protein